MKELMTKNWIDGPPVTADLFTHIVSSRNIDPAKYVDLRWPDHLHDPFLLPDMDKAAQRIWDALSNAEKIGIVGDYDMDGTPASVIIYEFLTRLGGKVEVILPTRDEGYGFSDDFVDRLAKKGVSLIITVDCGIRDVTAVEHAKKQSIDVIVTDHHECGELLPSALAIINPKRHDSNYPFRELCGTGVAYKLLHALQVSAPEKYKKETEKFQLAWSLDLVAMATIGDMVPLIDENRLFVHYGLKVLHRAQRPGLARFLQAIDVDQSKLSYRDIAFKIIPKFNACGRMATMNDVFDLLATLDPFQADTLVKTVLTYTTQSQLHLEDMLRQAKEQAEIQKSAPIILLSHDSWHPGLTGVVAGRLVEEYARPVGIFALIDGQKYRGSMRSISGVALPPLLSEASAFIEKFGGHEQAAGLTIAKDNFASFTQKLQTDVSLDNLPRENNFTDGTISSGNAGLEHIRLLDSLAPWGVGHPEPVWSLQSVKFENPQWLSNGLHLRATINDETGRLPVIYFGAQKAKDIIDLPLDVCGTLSVNEFRGNSQPQLMIKGLSPVKQIED